MTITQLNAFNPVTQQEGFFDTHLSGNCGTIYFLNKSLESMLITGDDGRVFGILPAQFAMPMVIPNPPQRANYTVFATENAVDTTLQQVQGISYTQNEDTSHLFSGPIPMVANIGNNVTTSSSNTLTNTGASPGTVFVEGKPSGQVADSVSLTVDGILTLNALLNGAMVQVFKTFMNIAGAPTGNQDVIQYGAANYVAENMGNEKVDGTFEAVGPLSADAGATIGGTGLGVTAGGIGVTGGIGINTGGLSVTGGNASFSNDVFLVNKKLSTAASGDLIDWSGVGCILKGNPSSRGKMTYKGNGSSTDWSLAFIGNSFTGTGGGTFNHGCTQFGAAVAPTDFFMNPSTGGGSNSLGMGSITTTQVSVGSLNAVAWKIQGMST